jgi:hypothetical protein
VGNAASQGGAAVASFGNYTTYLSKSIIAFSTGGRAADGTYREFRCCDVFDNTGGHWTGPIEEQRGVRIVASDLGRGGPPVESRSWTMLKAVFR